MIQTPPMDGFAGNPLPMGGSSPKSELAQKVRAKYPGAYDDLSDEELDARVRAKFPGVYDDIPGVQKSAASRFLSNAGEALNPVTALKAVGGAIMHPRDTAQALVDAQANRAIKAYDLAQEGRYSEAAGNAGAALLPVLGPMAADIGEQAGTGDIAGAAGKLTGNALLAALAGNSGKVIQPLQKVGGRALVAAEKAAPIVKAVAMEAAPELLLGAAGGAVAGPVGMVGGAGAAHVIRRAVVKVLRRQIKGLSEEKAAQMVEKMSEPELALAAKSAEASTLPARFDHAPAPKLDPRYDWAVDESGVMLPKGRGPYPEVPAEVAPPIAAPTEVSPAISDGLAEYRAKIAAEDAARKSAKVIRPDDAPSQLAAKSQKSFAADQAAAVEKQISEAISPQAAYDQLKTHGIGGKKIPNADAKAMVDAIWMAKDPSYRSMGQWMAERADKWNAMRTRSKK